jgi:3',5'-cyclic AMP phosphodiesterase CpdA
MTILTRRQVLAATAAGFGALFVSACASSTNNPSPSGSTLHSTWGDPTGDGQLRILGGEPLVDRTELGDAEPLRRSLGLLAHVTDAHVLDASSPARVTFLARLGPPFQSTFRPQEALTAHVLAAMIGSVRALAPDLVIEGGDLIDNDQHNELVNAIAAMSGGDIAPGSGPDGYYGVQSEFDPDPFYYRPAVDAPRHPGLLRDAVRQVRSDGAGAPWLPVLGDHDVLVQGELVPTDLTRALAVGDRALWTLPEGLSLPPGVELHASSSPDGPPLSGMVDQFLQAALQGQTVTVPPDPDRRQLSVEEAIGRLRAAAGRHAGGGEGTALGTPDRLDYVRDLGERLRIVVLDVASRIGGSGGQAVPGQVAFLQQAIASAGDRWVVFVTHQTLRQTAGGNALAAVLDASPRVILTLAGHTHHNRIRVRQTSAGGYWAIETASLVDWPQQSRALRFHETDGGVAIETWMLDHVSGPGSVARISRELSYLDAAGGRPGGFAGGRHDRNAVLFRRA